jgi:hypothetical protein
MSTTTGYRVQLQKAAGPVTMIPLRSRVTASAENEKGGVSSFPGLRKTRTPFKNQRKLLIVE